MSKLSALGDLWQHVLSAPAQRLRQSILRSLFVLVPLLFIEASNFFFHGAVTWAGVVTRWTFIVVVLFATSLLIQPLIRRWQISWQYLPLLVVGMATVAYVLTRQSTWAAWIGLGALYTVLLQIDRQIQLHAGSVTRWLCLGLAAALAGSMAVASSQIEANFAEEEFFVALEAAVLAIFWITMVVAINAVVPPTASHVSTEKRNWFGWFAVTVLSMVLILEMVVVARIYQQSFYSDDVPGFAGITNDDPFLCGDVSPDPTAYAGEAVFTQFLDQIERRPNRGSPEYGMLALGHQNEAWAQRFSESLLEEAAAGRFTAPTNSIKYSQYQASQRAYYYIRVRQMFPHLFSERERMRIESWFREINRRALTVEWVDGLYGLALSDWPEGPYLNQEIGAGLLALLEWGNLADPELSARNQRYLANAIGGWRSRFRNSDDTMTYQPIWIDNALFQTLNTHTLPDDHLRYAFEWMLLQAPPDGSILRYNHPVPGNVIGSAYLGALLLDDPRYIWWAGRMLEAATDQDGAPSAQPGVDRATPLVGVSPTEGSCLLYGNSGLPNRIGPLAPDKIVLRDGWAPDDAYLLLNLRFTGWHRYKATNTITLVHQDGPLVVEPLDPSIQLGWLPAGRQLLRDKRIPREHLNGLLLTRRGLDSVLQTLTGIGSIWTQDPPHYAEVISFETGAQFDRSQTRIVDWQGWQHERQITLYHKDGPIVVIDRAHGPSAQEAALAWHVQTNAAFEGDRMTLRRGDQPAEVLFLAVEGGNLRSVPRGPDGEAQTLIYRPAEAGKLHLITIFLLGEKWIGATAHVDTDQQTLVIVKGENRLRMPVQAIGAGDAAQ